MPSLNDLRIENSASRPYPISYYGREIAWRGTWLSIWQVSPFRLRPWILKVFGADIHPHNRIYASAKIKFPWHLRCGKLCAISPNVNIYNLGGINIGERVVISQGTHICGGTHDYTAPTMPLIRKEITIGSGVWICADAFIGPGVSIGEGAVVGARAVVFKDVEPWAIVAGNPATKIKTRTLPQADN